MVFNVGGCEREELVAEGEHEVVLDDGVGGEEEAVAEELWVFVDACMIDSGEEFGEEGCLAGRRHGGGAAGLWGRCGERMWGSLWRVPGV